MHMQNYFSWNIIVSFSIVSRFVFFFSLSLIFRFCFSQHDNVVVSRPWWLCTPPQPYIIHTNTCLHPKRVVLTACNCPHFVVESLYTPTHAGLYLCRPVSVRMRVTVFACTCMCVCLRLCVSVLGCTFACVCVLLFISKCVHVILSVFVCISRHLRACVSAWVRMRVCAVSLAFLLFSQLKYNWQSLRVITFQLMVRLTLTTLNI